jgi:hypothetical protein
VLHLRLRLYTAADAETSTIPAQVVAGSSRMPKIVTFTAFTITANGLRVPCWSGCRSGLAAQVQPHNDVPALQALLSLLVNIDFRSHYCRLHAPLLLGGTNRKGPA